MPAFGENGNAYAPKSPASDFSRPSLLAALSSNNLGRSSGNADTELTGFQPKRSLENKPETRDSEDRAFPDIIASVVHELASQRENLHSWHLAELEQECKTLRNELLNTGSIDKRLSCNEQAEKISESVPRHRPSMTPSVKTELSIKTVDFHPEVSTKSLSISDPEDSTQLAKVPESDESDTSETLVDLDTYCEAHDLSTVKKERSLQWGPAIDAAQNSEEHSNECKNDTVLDERKRPRDEKPARRTHISRPVSPLAVNLDVFEDVEPSPKLLRPVPTRTISADDFSAMTSLESVLKAHSIAGTHNTSGTLYSSKGSCKSSAMEAYAATYAKKLTMHRSKTLEKALEKNTIMLHDAWLQQTDGFILQETDGCDSQNFQPKSLFPLTRGRPTTINLVPDYKAVVQAYADNGSTDEKINKSRSWIGRRITHPSSIKRIIWDTLALVLIGYDTIMIPMQTFELPEILFTTLVGKISLCYWSLDIVFSLFVGYYKRGVLEMRPRKILLHYCATWMTFDICVVALDWTVEILDSGDVGSSSNAQVSKVGRTLKTSTRVIRSLRLLRLIKMRRILQDLQDNISSEYMIIFLRILKFVIIIVVINHVIACCWYGIGNIGGDGWVDLGTLPNFDEESLGYRYTTSLHWSLTQFTPASMEIFPVNVGERTFAVLTLLFALIVFSSFVSSITSAMTSLRKLGSQLGKRKQFTALRWYLRDNKIPHTLQVRITKYLMHTVAQRKYCTQAKDVELLALLSEPLQRELQQSIIAPLFGNHPYFNEYAVASPQAMRHVCTYAATQHSLSVGDVVCSPGETAKFMYFVVNGKLVYTDMHYLGTREEEDSGTDLTVKIDEYEWISEMSLWINRWVHRGEIAAFNHCDIVALSAEKFREVTTQDSKVVALSRRYAKYFSETLHVTEGPLSDLGRSSMMLDKGSHLPRLARREDMSRIRQSLRTPWEKMRKFFF